MKHYSNEDSSQTTLRLDSLRCDKKTNCAGLPRDSNGQPLLRGKLTGFFKRARAARLLSLALFIILCLPLAVRAEIVDRIVAVVNDSVITLSELNAATASAIESIGGKAKTEKEIIEIKGKILDSLIEQKLVKHAADTAGIEVSEREIDNAIEDVKEQNKLSQETLLLALAQSGLTYREYKEQLREQIRQIKFINKEFRSKINVTDEEVAEYYRRNTDEFYGPQAYDIAMIYISSAQTDDRAAKLKLQKIHEGLSAGEAFGALARLYSDGRGAAEGGEMGVIKVGELDSAIEAAALKLAPGEISPPVITSSGIYIIKLNKSMDAKPKTFEQVSEQIREKLFKKSMDDRFRFWLEETKKFAHLDIRL